MKVKKYSSLPISELENQKVKTEEICLFYIDDITKKAHIFYDKNNIDILKTRVHSKVKKGNREGYKLVCKHFVKTYGGYTTKIGTKYYTIESWS